MLDWIFDLPLGVTGPVIVASLCLLAIGGLLAVRRWVLPRLRIHIEDSEFSGSLVQSVMVFYGLAVALISVNVWETYGDVSKITSQEATTLASLYRDVSGYPQPARQSLQKELHDYVQYIIEEAWPLQRRGQVPKGGIARVNRFQNLLIGFEPVTEGQKLLHGETLRAYNHMIEARRLRLDAVNTGLPGVMWIVILVGSAISLSAAFFFRVDDVRLHALLVGLLAVFMGLIVFMILALDRPFRGDLGIGTQPYQLVYDDLMRPDSR